MRVAIALVLASVVLACSSASKPPAGPAVAPPPPAGEAVPDYCEGYKGCAEEQARMEDFEGRSDEELTPQERTELAAAVAARVDTCTQKWAAMQPYQQEWVLDCTGCGGSCDVYDCLDQANGVVPDQKFECDEGGE